MCSGCRGRNPQGKVLILKNVVYLKQVEDQVKVILFPIREEANFAVIWVPATGFGCLFNSDNLGKVLQARNLVD